MNYLTKRFFAILVLNICALMLWSQVLDSTLVRVTGVYNYQLQPYKMTMEFSLEENGQTCGPNSQFDSIDEQYAYLLDSLKYDQNITSRITEIEVMKNFESQYPRRTYSFETNNIEEFKIIRKHAEYAFAEDFAYYNHYRPSKLEDQDEAASKALEDAQIKIKKIARNLNAKKYELISIDDDTSSGLLGLDNRMSELFGYGSGLSKANNTTKILITGKDNTVTQRRYNLHVYYKVE